MLKLVVNMVKILSAKHQHVGTNIVSMLMLAFSSKHLNTDYDLQLQY